RPTSSGARFKFSSPNASSAPTVVVQSWSSGDCETKPTLAARAAAGSPREATPNQRTEPALCPPDRGGVNPATAPTSVDLPEPVGSATTVNEPAGSDRST